MKYAVEFPVRFGEIDHARVVYYPRFFHYFHQAFESWFGEALGVPYHELLDKHNVGFPAVSVETEFRSPLRYGDTVRVQIEVVEIGRKSLTLAYTATRLPGETLSASAKITTAAIDNNTFESIRIPEEFVRLFERFRDGP